MAATGCSGKSVPSSVSVSQQKLQEMLARRFPRQFPVAGLLHLDLKAPQLSMIPERNMLNAVIPAELSGKVLKEQYSGLLNVDFALRYEPTDRTLRAYQIQVNQLSMDGLSPALSDMLGTYATALAEYFRAQGKDVLLLMDSVTRYAMAQREIALAIGEPPVTKGYPPSVFARLPQLIERAGNAANGGGSITGFYTVLSEGDDQQDPIADAARAILDGHFVLSRKLAEQGHYPAIDIEQSISRVMSAIVPREQLDTARRFKQLYARYQRNRDLIAVGAYARGSDPMTDQAIARYPDMEAFLQQGMFENESREHTLEKMNAVLA